MLKIDAVYECILKILDRLDDVEKRFDDLEKNVVPFLPNYCSALKSNGTDRIEKLEYIICIQVSLFYRFHLISVHYNNLEEKELHFFKITDTFFQIMKTIKNLFITAYVLHK